MNGNQIIWTFSLSYRISHRVDTEISLSRPESWGTGVFSKTFSESDGTITRVRDCKIQHTNGPYPHSDDYPAEICGKCGSRENEGDDE